MFQRDKCSKLVSSHLDVKCRDPSSADKRSQASSRMKHRHRSHPQSERCSDEQQKPFRGLLPPPLLRLQMLNLIWKEKVILRELGRKEGVGTAQWQLLLERADSGGAPPKGAIKTQNIPLQPWRRVVCSCVPLISCSSLLFFWNEIHVVLRNRAAAHACPHMPGEFAAYCLILESQSSSCWWIIRLFNT